MCKLISLLRGKTVSDELTLESSLKMKCSPPPCGIQHSGEHPAVISAVLSWCEPCVQAHSSLVASSSCQDRKACPEHLCSTGTFGSDGFLRRSLHCAPELLQLLLNRNKFMTTNEKYLLLVHHLPVL